MNVLQLFIISGLAIFLLVLVFKVVVEPFYVLVFNKPIYVHCYPYSRKLTIIQRKILHDEFVFYRKLNTRRKRYFEHRVATFIVKYPFYGKDGFIITDQSKVLIAATFVMLTFGMRHYLIDVFNKIIVYPQSYFSTINQEYHKGEFNPRLKILVFSWQDFQEGFSSTNDNLNLGLHEFSHALHFHGLKSRDQSSIVFADAYVKLKEYLKRPEVVKQLIASSYFRIYAFTNQIEFVAVILEHFFETSSTFKKEFPELYGIVKRMINYNESDMHT
jgi:Mlc titration factor MtfA (ptsG expression regulator)